MKYGKRKPIDIGGRYGRLLILEQVFDPKFKRRAVLVLCDCGREFVTEWARVDSGHTKSCGCLLPDTSSKTNRTHGYTCGRKETPEYATWKAMRRRCGGKMQNDQSNRDYYGRGIRVCERWDVFQNFLDDMGLKPSAKHSIERIDNNRGYEPENCRWATRIEQQRNTRRNRKLMFRGEIRCLVEIAEMTGVSRVLIADRLNAGWSIENAVCIPPKPTRRVA